MKKFFTLCCCALFGSMLAQAQISITCDGVEVKEGDVLTFYAAEDDFGDYTAGPLMDPNFKNTTDHAFDITVKVKTSDNAKNGGLNWCGITMQCQDIKGGSEERTGTLKPGGFGLNMQLHGVFQKDDFKTYEASVTVYKGMEYVSSFKEVFVYDGKDHTGISTAENVRRMTFDGQAVHYSFGSAAPRTLRVCHRRTARAQRGPALTARQPRPQRPAARHLRLQPRRERRDGEEPEGRGALTYPPPATPGPRPARTSSSPL